MARHHRAVGQEMGPTVLEGEKTTGVVTAQFERCPTVLGVAAITGLDEITTHAAVVKESAIRRGPTHSPLRACRTGQM
jgi:hypothetical protein